MSDFKLVDPVDLDDDERMRIIGELNAKNKIKPQLPITGVASPEIRTPITPILEQQYLKANALGASANLSKNITPTQAAKNSNLSNKTKIPLPLYWDNEELTKQSEDLHRDQLASRNDWYQSSIDYPALTRNIADPTTFALSNDDHENLSWFERQLVMSKKGFASGKSQLKLAELASKERERVRLTGVWDNKDDLEYKKINDEISTNQVNTMNLLYNTASVLPMMGGSLVEGFKGNIKGSLPTYALGMGVSALTRGRVSPEQALKAAQTIGKGTGTLAAVSYTANIEGAFAFEQYKNLKTVDGNRLNPKKVIAVSDWVGLAAGTLEATGTFIIAKTMSKPILAMLSKELSRIPGADNLGKVISNNPDKFSGLTLQKALQLAGKEYLKSIGAEVGTESLQTIVSTGIGQSALQIGTDKPISQPNFAERLGKELPDTIAKTISSTALLAGAGAGAKFAELKPSIQSVKKQAELVSDINEAVAYKKELGETMDTYNRSTTTKRDRETGLKIITDIAKEHGKDKIYWDKTEAKNAIDQIVNDHIEKSDVPLTQDEVLEKTGLDVLYQRINDDTEQNIDHIEMPLNELMDTHEQVQSITGTDFYKAIQDDVSSSPDQSTYRQAMEHYKNVEQEWENTLNEQVESNKIQVEQEKLKDPVFNDIKNQLIKAGEKPEKASTQARVATEAIYQEAERSKITLEEVQKKLLPKIVKTVNEKFKPLIQSVTEEVDAELKESLPEKIRTSLGDTPVYMPKQMKAIYEEAFKKHGIKTTNRKDGSKSIADISKENNISIDKLKDELSNAAVKQSEINKQVKEAKIAGATEFTGDTPIISLFKHKNASTFMHEMAHVFLRNKFEFIKTKQADQEYINDWNTLAEWLGVKEDQEMLTETQEEQFASGFEAYLKNGQAPSTKLITVFNRFRKWLTSLYSSLIESEDMKTLRENGWIIEPRIGEGVKVSPAVKQVMDRMLASDIAIQEALRMTGLNKQLKAIGLTATEREYIELLRQSGQDKAITKILVRQMRELDPEFKKEAKEFRDSAYERNKKEIELEPIYQAMDMIENAVGMKIDKYLVEAKKDDNLKVGLDQIAQLFRFETGEELFNELLNTNPKDIEIEIRTENDYNERYQELRNDSRFGEKAIEALQNSEIIRLIAYEKNVLEVLNQETEALKEKIAETENRVKKINFESDAELASKLAKKHFFFMPINEVSKPDKFISQARNAAVNSDRYQRSGDIKNALLWKRKQLFAQALARESAKINTKIKKNKEFLKKFTKMTTAQMRVKLKDQECSAQVSKILNRFGLDHKWVSNLDKSLVKPLFQWVTDPEIEKYGILDLPDFILDESQQYDIGDLTLDQLQDVVNSIKNITKLNNAYHKNLTAGARAKRADEKKYLITDANENLSGTERDLSKVSQVKNFSEMINTTTDYLSSQLENLERTVDFMGGFKGINGSWWQAFYGRISNAREQQLKMEVQADKEYEAIQKKYYTVSEMASLLGYTLKNGKTFRKKFYVPELRQHLVKADLICMFWNLGNETNEYRLLSGYKTKVKNEDGTTSKVPSFTKDEVIDAINNHLSKKDLDYAQDVLSWIDSYWNPIEELYVDLTGFAPEKVEAQPIITKHGDYKGGYFPLKRDFSKSGGLTKEVAADKALEDGNIIMASTKNGHTEARVRGAQYPVLLDINIPKTHIATVIHDLAFRKTIIDINSLLRDRDIEGTIIEYFGINTFDKFNKINSIVANAGRSERLGMFGLKQKAFRRNVTTSMMLGKLSISLQNLVNLINFSKVSDDFNALDTVKSLPGIPQYILGSIKYTKDIALGSIQHAINKQFEQPEYMNTRLKFATDRSVKMRKRFSVGAERDLLDNSKKLFGKETPISDFFAGIIIYTDKLVAVPIWTTAYEKQKAMGRSEKDAIDFADYIIRNSLGSSLPEDLSLIMHGDENKKMFTMFYTFMNNQLGLNLQLYRKAKYSKTTAKRFQAAIGLAAMILVSNVVSELIAFRGPKEDDDVTTWLAKTVLKGFTGTVIGLRELQGLYEGYLRRGRGDISSPIINAFEKVATSPLIPFDERLEPREKAQKTAQGIGLLTGFPQIGINEMFYMLDVMNGDAELTVSGVVKGRAD